MTLDKHILTKKVEHLVVTTFPITLYAPLGGKQKNIPFMRYQVTFFIILPRPLLTRVVIRMDADANTSL
jgi:hypothetical protein